MTIFFHKGLIRNPEIGNTPVGVSLNIWRLGRVGIPNLARMSLIKCYGMLHKNASVTAFTVCELFRENQQEGVKLPPLTQIRVKKFRKDNSLLDNFTP